MFFLTGRRVGGNIKITQPSFWGKLKVRTNKIITVSFFHSLKLQRVKEPQTIKTQQSPFSASDSVENIQAGWNKGRQAKQQMRAEVWCLPLKVTRQRWPSLAGRKSLGQRQRPRTCCGWDEKTLDEKLEVDSISRWSISSGWGVSASFSQIRDCQNIKGELAILLDRLKARFDWLDGKNYFAENLMGSELYSTDCLKIKSSLIFENCFSRKLCFSCLPFPSLPL